MHKAVPWISAAANPPLSLGALYFIDELAERICGSRPDAVPNPSNEFSTEWWPFRRLCNQLGITAEEGPIPIILNFPELEVNSHLLLPLYGHELGHTAVETRELARQVLDTHNAIPKFAASFNDARDQIAGATNQTHAEAGVSLGWRLLWWITELLCDQLAIQALGPSFLYAFCSALLGDAWDEPGERHPPTSVRVRHLLDSLRQAGWDDDVQTRTPRILSWLDREVAATEARTRDPAGKFLTSAVEHMQATIRSTAGAHLGSETYSPSQFRAEIGEITGLTDCATLPAQLPEGDPIDRRSIMLAAWISVLEGHDSPTGLAEAPSDVTSQAFYAKAIEMSAVLKAWSETG